jgi:hypothetical protein
MSINTWGDVSAIAQRIEENATFVIRETDILSPLIRNFRDMTGMNLRRGYAYNSVTANEVSDADDLTSQSFTPSADQTLTPFQIGAQIFITDARAASELPEDIIRDSSLELGIAASSKIQTDISGDFSSLTGGTVGAAGSTITWGYLSAAIAQARNANKSSVKPLVAVMHGYQAETLAASASVAGATVFAEGARGAFSDQMTRRGPYGFAWAVFQNVPLYQVYQDADASDDYTGAVFPVEALAIDWRQAIRIEPQRDASRRGWEFNMSGIYDTGIWKPERGVQMVFDATAPTS